MRVFCSKFQPFKIKVEGKAEEDATLINGSPKVSVPDKLAV